ncbi:MAG: peptide-methionine (S)-S-oxide reductase MsrA [Spirochaetaceae bacterium]|nr:peptide-methionine (S)-S-oxide reductase MsrA [Spirochaetaceae bacterium]
MEQHKAYLACGCFWGVQYYFDKLNGVTATTVGYMGGSAETAHYPLIKAGGTEHKEVIEVIYDPAKLSYREALKFFFELHDFTQTDGQGPDIGTQYLSVVFYQNKAEQEKAEQLITYLNSLNYKVATKLEPFSNFYKAEDYHQNYYVKNGEEPYCHLPKKLNWDR